MNKYPSISLSCIATIDYEEAVYAVLRSLAGLPRSFEEISVYWFSDIDFPGGEQLKAFKAENPDRKVEFIWVEIPPFLQFQSFNEQISKLTLYLIPQIVETDFNLIVQNDGYVVNPESWTDEFLQYDYIGATWPQYESGEDVGNGGFCLRSRKLYQALMALEPPIDFDALEKRFPNIDSYIDRFGYRSVPEDYIICTLFGEQLKRDFDIQIAPSALAEQFSVECNFDSDWLGKSFGFHSHMAKSFYPNA